ncbi:hypothetical protein VN23_19330 [Janthinobacterium sp. B9-8]|nr:hypothetical protein VN23_19330 [Janthinobacterium sp. B9-8]
MFAFLYEILLITAVVLLAEGLFQGVFQLISKLPVTAMGDQLWLRVLNFVWIMSVAFAYFAWCWRGGQTLAMRTWSIHLVKSDGSSVGWREVALRFSVAAVCMLPCAPFWVLARHQADLRIVAWLLTGLFFLPFLWAILDKERRFLHDRLAGTQLLIAPPKT